MTVFVRNNFVAGSTSFAAVPPFLRKKRGDERSTLRSA
jgi:hypothetical protein